MTHPPPRNALSIVMSIVCPSSASAQIDDGHLLMRAPQNLNDEIGDTMDGGQHDGQKMSNHFRLLTPFVLCLSSISKGKKKMRTQNEGRYARAGGGRWTDSFDTTTEAR